MWWIDQARAPARILASGAACAMALAGCADAPASASKISSEPAGFVKEAKTPLDQYALSIDRSPQVVALTVHPSGVSANQRAALQHFVEHWRETGGTEAITVATPANSTEAADPRLAGSAVAALLNALGVPPSRLNVASYDASGTPGAPIYARYERYMAQGPDCTRGWTNFVATKDNKPIPHFGCADAANLAAMVADPHDLERPVAIAPADSVRRSVVLDKYRQGVITSSAKDDQAQGTVSQAVN